MQNLNLYEGRAKSSVTNRLPWFLSQVYFELHLNGVLNS